MIRKTLAAAAAALLSYGGFAQNQVLNYDSEGNFKILQLTDIHYKPGNPVSEEALTLIREVLAAEKPDLVTITGDLAWAQPAKQAFDEVLAEVIATGIPWTFVFGNHDDEFELSRRQIMDYIVQKPGCLARHGDRHLEGVGNYILELKDAAGDSVRNVLYFMDSHSYSRIPGIGGYDWLGSDQIGWYRRESAAYARQNGNRPVNSLLFMHIPLHEYALMTAAGDSLLVGTRGEAECNGRINPGMFAAIKEMGDVVGVFVGHDHDNDYIGDYYGVALAYGRYSGANTVYNNLGTTGCRVIELRQGERGFSTYIRLRGGEKIYPVKYPDAFVKK